MDGIQAGPLQGRTVLGERGTAGPIGSGARELSWVLPGCRITPSGGGDSQKAPTSRCHLHRTFAPGSSRSLWGF